MIQTSYLASAAPDSQLQSKVMEAICKFLDAEEHQACRFDNRCLCPPSLSADCFYFLFTSVQLYAY